MMASLPNAFGVRFGELARWNPASFYAVQWQWPANVIVPLSKALARRDECFDSKEGTPPPMATLHFDGALVPRDLRGKERLKGKLFRAEAGNVVYSKIDVRNGAIGIVPDSMSEIAVTSEFPVYRVHPDIALPEYVHLLFRTAAFRRQINSMISGASGRKRVEPAALEGVRIPLPPLAVQRAIVAEWHKARKAIAEAEEKAKGKEAEIETQFFSALGLTLPTHNATSKIFGIGWQDLSRWGVDVTRETANRPTLAKAKYPVVRLSDVISDLENGWSPKCLSRPTIDDEWGVLKLGAVSFGNFDPTENKALPSGLAPRSKYEIKAGDLLISRANITRLVGACALVEHTPPRLLLCDKIFRVVWNPQVSIHKPFLSMVLKTPYVRWQIENNVTGGSPTMKNITKPNLLALQFPLPPPDVQEKIMNDIAVMRQLIKDVRHSAAQTAQRIEVDMEAYLLGRKKVTAS